MHCGALYKALCSRLKDFVWIIVYGPYEFWKMLNCTATEK